MPGHVLCRSHQGGGQGLPASCGGHLWRLCVWLSAYR